MRVFPSREWAISRVSRGAVPTLLFSPRVLTFTKLSFSRICSLITVLAILCNILFLTAHIVSLLLLIDWEWMQECAFHCVSPEPILDFWGLYAELSRQGGVRVIMNEWMKSIYQCFTPSLIVLAESARETVSLPWFARLSTLFFCLEQETSCYTIWQFFM